MSGENTFIKEQDFKVIGGPLEASIAGGGAAYAPAVGTHNQVNSLELPKGGLFMVESAAIDILDAGGGERARAKLVDSNGNIYASILGSAAGRSQEQSESGPLAKIIDCFDAAKTLSITIDEANPNPVKVAARFTLKAVIPNPTRHTISHQS